MMQQIRNTSFIFSSEMHTPKRGFYKKIVYFQPLKNGLCRQKTFHVIDIPRNSMRCVFHIFRKSLLLNPYNLCTLKGQSITSYFYQYLSFT